MLGVLLLVLLMWIYSVAASVMVLKGDFSPQQKRDCVRWFVVRYCFDILVNWEVLVMGWSKVKHNITDKSVVR